MLMLPAQRRRQLPHRLSGAVIVVVYTVCIFRILPGHDNRDLGIFEKSPVLRCDHGPDKDDPVHRVFFK